MNPADHIWFGGDILTMDPHQPRATALAVTNGRIVAVGSDQDVRNLTGPSTREIDLGGAFLMPGLIESHTHALWGACRTLFDVYVGYGASMGELMDAVRSRSAQLGPDDVVFGGPWRHDMRAEMGAIPRAILDRISSRQPIVLVDTSQHLIWCNSRALDLAGIGPDTPNPPGGVIERDPATGVPNGILAESAAAPVRVLVKRSSAQMDDAARECVRYFNGLGFTGFKEPMAYEAELRAYRDADQRGELTLHAAAHIVRTSPLASDGVPYDEMEALRQGYASENLRTDFAKLFLDGVVGGYTASFLEPYLGGGGYDVAGHEPDATLLIAPEVLKDELRELDRRGFTVKMHAVGDNAVRKGLDAIQAARETNGSSGLRHEISHMNYVSDADVARLQKLDAVAEISPKMWYPNPVTATQIALLGEDRVAKNHRIRDLHQAGAEMVYASDWPAAAPDANPWTGLSGMLTRRNCDPAYPGILGPDQAIPLETALPIFTRNAARALKMEGETGILAQGAWADFIVLDKALDKMAPDEICEVVPRQTFWKGREVFAR